ncbi:MAG: hypothetical protein QM619_11830 [Micropruina sp.]|uniref:hypothetical protein n=1 Tax=Micropruina sp. TaxID=2737536 RepID=UPI0039E481F5
MTGALVLDAGALIAVERRSTRIQALLTQARERRLSIVVPTPVVAQVVRSGGRPANLRRFLADATLRYVALDLAAALDVGALLEGSGSSDVIDGFVAVCARRLDGCPVVTTDPDHIARLDPTLPLIAV